MARISLSAQLEAALLRANKAEAQVTDLTKINAVLRAKAYGNKAKAAPAAVPSFADKARAYCAAHGVRSCMKDQLLAWNP